jgi:hypothetical protein
MEGVRLALGWHSAAGVARTLCLLLVQQGVQLEDLLSQ